MASKTSISCSETQNNTNKHPIYIPNHIPDPSYVRILDTTLRDGEQSPGAAMMPEEKLDIARQLAKLGVDIIEAGFPCASNDDFNAVKMIAQEVGNDEDCDGYVPVIAGVCRCNEKDIAIAWEAVKHAKRPRLCTFIATSPIHMEYKLKKGKDEVIKAGATTVNITDTVGIAMPVEFGKLIADIKANTIGIENVVIATHCHNDLGLATANTLEGARFGARQLEVTINGIGERAGNASLEEDGMLKNKATYEIICPEDIGLERSNGAGIVLGKLSGRHGFRNRLEELGYELEDEEVESLFWHFKATAGKKKRVTDADLRAMVSNEVVKEKRIWKLGDLQVICGTLAPSTTTVKLVKDDGSTHVACSVGIGPVDSTFKAVNLIVKEPVKLLEYTMNVVKEGINIIATAHVVLFKDHQTFSGTGSGFDVVVSSVEAYIVALNKMLGFKE
ncbi:unnamed protein product [Lupinus luteus]|uniref:2-isopropylmalate synthase n=1 Tax=Lupinus luteus TaxID=3873 RepID=A0AAV1XSQ4_LUPLU